MNDKIKDMRHGAGLSQVELAARAGTTQSYVSQVELGKTEPSLGWLREIARACGCTVVINFEKTQ